MSEQKKALRKGFSTGACAAACAKGAALLYQEPDRFSMDLSVLFPDEKYRNMKFHQKHFDEDIVAVSIIKDAGDDPDITDQAEISCFLREIGKQDIDEKDYVSKLDQVTIVIRGGNGVGLVTRGGLDVPKGKWAINPVPRQMILDNLRDIGLGNERKWLLFEISVKNGEELAKKTLNPLLGIKDGISILGTSGLVVPYSNSSYLETIRILIRNAAINDLDTIVLCTGSRTHHAARSEFPALPEEAFIRIADFISEALGEAGKYRFKLVVISCMPGKLFKYAQGFNNTHAHKNKLDTNKLSENLAKVGIAKQRIADLIQMPSIREIIESVSEVERNEVLRDLAGQSLKNIKKWLGNADCALYCFDYDRNVMGKWS